MNAYNAFIERNIKHVQSPTTGAMIIYQCWSLLIQPLVPIAPSLAPSIQTSENQLTRVARYKRHETQLCPVVAVENAGPVVVESQSESYNNKIASYLKG